jgi:DNA-binding LacI/PurR family transcriptional regulator
MKIKHQHIFKELRRAITDGEYKEGQRLPSEAELVERFATSRPTVARALRELQHLGLIERRAGSGTYVRRAAGARPDLFGLLIPGLGETEIFEPICREMSRFSQTTNHALLWGDTTDEAYTKEEQAEQLCQQYIARKVSGVFFAPLELTPNKDAVNQRIVDALERAHIPIVLLDRCLYEYPRRSRFDLVGIDNRRAGYVVTQHLLNLGCRRIAFFARPRSAETVANRINGYRDALAGHGITPDPAWICYGDPSDPECVKQIMAQIGAEAFVCANDITAANLMHTFDQLGIRIPLDVRIVGIDDVKYAKLLRVPLTTLHQPCRHIGAAAVRAMMERIACPDMPARTILLDCKLIVRESCGATLNPAPEKLGAGFN